MFNQCGLVKVIRGLLGALPQAVKISAFQADGTANIMQIEK
jgi:hypothetical protein